MLISVQYLRALAALAVTFFHLFPVFFPQAGNIFASGAAGVDVFFVISGFIMWHITSEKAVGPIDFLKHRVIRVVPLYWLVTLCLAFVVSVKPNLFPLDSAEASHIVLSMLFIPHINPATGAIGPILIQGWTLEYEALFYLCFAASLFLAPSKRLAALSTLILVPVLLGAIFQPTDAHLRWLTSTFMVEFYLGILVAIAVSRGALIPKGIAISMAIISLGLIVSEAMDHGRLLKWGVPSAMLVWAAISIEKDKALIKSNALLLLGNASYSIYLVHYLASSALNIVLDALGIDRLGVGPFATAVTLAVIGGILTYKLVELPVTNWLRQPNGSAGASLRR